MEFQALVHVSTAYCNCDRAVVDEMVYPPPFEPDHIVNLVNWMGEDLLDEVTPSLIGTCRALRFFKLAIIFEKLCNIV